MKSHLSFQSRVSRIAITLCTLLLMVNTAVAQEKVKLVRVLGDDGKETSLYQKLITVKGPVTAIKEGPSESAKAQYVTPYNIFYHAKTAAGKKEQAGYYRVADRDGTPRGWVLKEDVTIWATRFAIEPKRINAQNTFVVEKVILEGKERTFAYDPAEMPGDATVNAFILGESEGKGEGAEDNGPFPVAFIVARTDSSGTADELNQIRDMKLEVVFIIETTDFMGVEYGGKPLIQYVKELAAEYVQTIKSNSSDGNERSTRLGLILYEDTNTAATLKRPVIAQSLTGNTADWLSAVNRIQPHDIGGDLPEDGLSALAGAVTNAKVGWTTNSSKHIVMIGKGAFQVDGQGTGGRPPVDHFLDFLGDRNHVIFKNQWDSYFGFNSSGASIGDIHSVAFPTGGKIGDRLRQTKNIHMIRVGRTLEEKFGTELLQKVKQLNNTVAQLGTKDQILMAFARLAGPQKTFYRTCYKIAVFDHFEDKALGQYRTAARDGFFADLKPTTESVKQVTNDLKVRIDEAIKVIADVAKGNADKLPTDGQGGNEFTIPIFKLVGSTLKTGEVIKQPVRIGIAEVRGESGHLVGYKVVMVSREELQRLGGHFSQLYEEFEKRRARPQRQDVTVILDALKRSLTRAAIGEKTIDADTELEELITDLPLRTETLKLTAGDIAVMPTRDFEEWLSELKTAEKRVLSLLTADATRWVRISSLGKKKDEYGFLKITELP